jgi:hypothetical protein
MIIDENFEQSLIKQAAEHNLYKIHVIKILKLIRDYVSTDELAELEQIDVNDVLNYKSYGSIINYNKFRTVIKDDTICKLAYDRYKARKTKSMIQYFKDNPELNDFASLSFFIKKYGEIDGPIKYNECVDKKRTTTVDFFMKKYNVDRDTAKEMLSERQRTFSLKKCIERHGEEAGLEMWIKRQEKWQKSLNNKSPNERFLINLKKSLSYPSNACYILGCSIEDYNENMILELVSINTPLRKIKTIAQYSLFVRALTEFTYQKYIDIIDPDRKRSDDYHLDHIYSVSAGFYNNVDPFIVANPKNLRMITSEENLKKSSKCDIELCELNTIISESEYSNFHVDLCEYSSRILGISLR